MSVKRRGDVGKRGVMVGVGEPEASSHCSGAGALIQWRWEIDECHEDGDQELAEEYLLHLWAFNAGKTRRQGIMSIARRRQSQLFLGEKAVLWRLLAFEQWRPGRKWRPLSEKGRGGKCNWLTWFGSQPFLDLEPQKGQPVFLGGFWELRLVLIAAVG